MTPRLKLILLLVAGGLILALAGALVLQRLWHEPRPGSPTIAEAPCLDVAGKVLGRLKPNATVLLFEVARPDYHLVMETVRTAAPMSQTVVKAGQGFHVGCLGPGDYALAIPAEAYDHNFGSPLPFETSQANLTLDIVFQGGDSQWAVGAFTIRPGLPESLEGRFLPQPENVSPEES